MVASYYVEIFHKALLVDLLNFLDAHVLVKSHVVQETNNVLRQLQLDSLVAKVPRLLQVWLDSCGGHVDQIPTATR